MRDPEPLAKEKNLTTVCDVVEILEEANMRPPESLAKDTYI